MGPSKGGMERTKSMRRLGVDQGEGMQSETFGNENDGRGYKKRCNNI